MNMNWRRRWSACLHVVHLALPAVGLIAFGGAAMSAVGLCLAEEESRQDDPALIRLASRIGNHAYWERLAELERGYNVDSLRQALRLNPRASSAWISLGLALERDGDFEGAERALRSAVEVDHQYLPIWSLTNFAFRHENWELFWSAAKQTSRLTYDDYRPLLQLGDLVAAGQPDTVLQKLGPHAPLERAYLDFLIAESRLKDGVSIARHMGARHDPNERARLIDFTDRLIRANDPEPAAEIWAGLNPLSDRAQPIFNPAFASAPLGLGFDWRLPSSDYASWAPCEVRIRLDGSQEDDTTLLEQWLVLPPRGTARYRLVFEVDSQAADSATGLRWILLSRDPATGQNRQVESIPFEQGDSSGKPASWLVDYRGSGLARLALVYRREPGTVRTPVRITIRKVTLETT
jgi:tetratricopeptide (TPR) repeat protein